MKLAMELMRRCSRRTGSWCSSRSCVVCRTTAIALGASPNKNAGDSLGRVAAIVVAAAEDAAAPGAMVPTDVAAGDGAAGGSIFASEYSTAPVSSESVYASKSSSSDSGRRCSGCRCCGCCRRISVATFLGPKDDDDMLSIERRGAPDDAELKRK